MRERTREQVLRALEVVPSLRRTVEDLGRIELIDRSLAVGAQALLALVPLVVVLAAFLPADLTAASVARFADVTGVSSTSEALVTHQVEPLRAGSEIRTQTGLVGLVIAIFSATSFARALMRAYERVWELPSVSGFRGRRRGLGWLIGWLVSLQLLVLPAWARGRVESEVDLRPLRLALGSATVGLQVVVACLVWWWTLRVLLSGRVSWSSLVAPAILTGVCVVAYTSGSAVVMPHYAASSAAQFGTFGLVLAVATWLVGIAGVVIAAAVVGRVISEDEPIRSAVGRLVARVRAGRGRR